MTFMPKQGGGASIFGGATEPDDIGSLALLNAMGSMQQAGLQRTATPMGSIAQNLLPIFGAMIYAKAASAQAASQAQKDQVDLDYKKALTEKARRPDGAAGGAKNLQQLLAQRIEAGKPIDDVVEAIKKTQNPASTEWGARMAVAGGNPELALQQKRADENAHVEQLAQLGEELRQRKIAADEKKRLDAPAEKTNTYAYSPATGARMSTARQADLDSGAAIKLSGNDQRAWTNAKDAWRQLDELEALVPKVLRGKGGLLNTPISIVSGEYGKRTGDPKWTRFDQLGSFLKFPVLQATVRGRPPLSESKTIREVGETDTQESALDKIHEFRAQLLGIGDVLGFSPDAIKQSAYPPPTNAPGAPTSSGAPVEMDWDKQKLGRAYMELKAQHPEKSDAELGNMLREQVLQSTGVQ